MWIGVSAWSGPTAARNTWLSVCWQNLSPGRQMVPNYSTAKSLLGNGNFTPTTWPPVPGQNCTSRQTHIALWIGVNCHKANRIHCRTIKPQQSISKKTPPEFGGAIGLFTGRYPTRKPGTYSSTSKLSELHFPQVLDLNHAGRQCFADTRLVHSIDLQGDLAIFGALTGKRAQRDDVSPGLDNCLGQAVQHTRLFFDEGGHPQARFARPAFPKRHGTDPFV